MRVYLYTPGGNGHSLRLMQHGLIRVSTGFFAAHAWLCSCPPVSCL